jgi:hypothetical protein
MKSRWLKALRSGRYTKRNRALFGKNNECCALGVLVDIYDRRNKAEYDWLFDLLGNFGVPAVFNANDEDFRDDKDFNNVAAWIEKNVPVKETAK